jgi:hypothetical protein
MTPLAVVVAVFGTEQHIFDFNRNRKTFAVCLLLMILALKMYTYLVYITRKLGLLQKIIAWIIPSQSKHTVDTLGSQGKPFPILEVQNMSD